MHLLNDKNFLNELKDSKLEYLNVFTYMTCNVI